ncbi:MAG: hypothetical protein FH748_10190 [Balneolaceae bacterium]|nr:hypothetical protein [Balneolaceae bacterium]
MPKNIKSVLLFIIFFLICNSKAFSQSRVFKDVELQVEEEMVLSDHEIFLPMLLDINRKGEIIFFDFAEYNIVSVNMDDFKFKLFGKGKGRGPGEFSMVMDLRISDSDDILFADPRKRKLIEWNLESGFKKEYKLENKHVIPSRIVVCENSGAVYVLSSRYGKSGIFHKYSRNIKHMVSFQEKAKRFEKQLPFYTDGEISCDKDGNLFYAAKYANIIRKYDGKGTLIFETPVYDFEPNEEVIQRNGNFFDLADGVRRASGDTRIVDDNLIVGHSGREDAKLELLDVYSTKDATYRYSIKMPHTFQEFVMYKDYIVVLREDGQGEIRLTIYKHDITELF